MGAHELGGKRAPRRTALIERVRHPQSRCEDTALIPIKQRKRHRHASDEADIVHLVDVTNTEPRRNVRDCLGSLKLDSRHPSLGLGDPSLNFRMRLDLGGQDIERRDVHHLIQRPNHGHKVRIDLVPHRTELATGSLQLSFEALNYDAGGFAGEPRLDLVDGRDVAGLNPTLNDSPTLLGQRPRALREFHPLLEFENMYESCCCLGQDIQPCGLVIECGYSPSAIGNIDPAIPLPAKLDQLAEYERRFQRIRPAELAGAGEILKFESDLRIGRQSGLQPSRLRQARLPSGRAKIWAANECGGKGVSQRQIAGGRHHVCRLPLLIRIRGSRVPWQLAQQRAWLWRIEVEW